MERANLVASLHAAADMGNHGVVWRLSRGIWRHLYRNGYHDDCLASLQRVLLSAARTKDDRTSAIAHNYMAATYFRWGRWAEARDNIRRAMAGYAAIGDRHEWAMSLANLGRIELRTGNYAFSLDCMERSAEVHAELGYPAIVITARDIDVGHANMLLGRYAMAREQFERYLRYAEDSGSEAGCSVALGHLGMLELRVGRFAAALDMIDRSERLQAFGDAADLAELICTKGSAYRGLGDLRQALQWQLQSLEVMVRSGSLYHECDVRIELAITLHLAGEDDEAEDHVNQALTIADRLNILPQRAKALDVLATITNDDTIRAEAIAIYEQLGLPRTPITPTLEK